MFYVSGGNCTTDLALGVTLPWLVTVMEGMGSQNDCTVTGSTSVEGFVLGEFLLLY